MCWITDARDRGVPDATVVVFAADRQLWNPSSRFLTMAKTGRDGTFRVRGLPPAEYFAAAVDLEVDGEWQDPAFLDAVFSAATRVTLIEGEKVPINLKLVAR